MFVRDTELAKCLALFINRDHVSLSFLLGDALDFVDEYKTTVCHIHT